MSTLALDSVSSKASLRRLLRFFGQSALSLMCKTFSKSISASLEGLSLLQCGAGPDGPAGFGFCDIEQSYRCN